LRITVKNQQMFTAMATAQRKRMMSVSSDDDFRQLDRAEERAMTV
jgi:hypothetical protein